MAGDLGEEGVLGLHGLRAAAPRRVRGRGQSRYQRERIRVATSTTLGGGSPPETGSDIGHVTPRPDRPMGGERRDPGISTPDGGLPRTVRSRGRWLHWLTIPSQNLRLVETSQEAVLVRTIHRPGPPRRRPRPGGSAAAQPQLHRHRAHPARADPRGRRRRGQGPRVARHLARGRAQPGRRDHRSGRVVARRATSRSRRAPRRSSSSRCARRCSSATTTSAPSTSCSA